MFKAADSASLWLISTPFPFLALFLFHLPDTMRLIDTTSFEFQSGEHAEFREKGYAVLSHRWLPQEITLDQLGSHIGELRSGTTGLSPQLDKIRGACEIARGKGIKWVWIDSCCIDKRDLVETTESINAMYKWYHNSKLCITYLYDVKKNDAIAITDPHVFDRPGQDQPSEWFSRGWTLQELLAPRQMEFYDKDWSYIGTKKETNTSIGTVTGIDEEYLNGETDFRTACIAQKMSWMVGRTTTREEDIAYSMIGLFGINMTPIYGEGKHAFIRLQEELLASRAMDESLFAWRMPALNAGDQYNGSRGSWAADEWGLLAPSPEWFARSASIRTLDGLPQRPGGPFKLEPTGITGPVGRIPFTSKIQWWYFTAYIGFMLGILPGIIPYLYTRHLVKKIHNENYTFMLYCIEMDANGVYKQVGIHLRPMVRVEGLHHFTMFVVPVVLFKRVRCTELGRISRILSNAAGFVPQPVPADL